MEETPDNPIGFKNESRIELANNLTDLDNLEWHINEARYRIQMFDKKLKFDNGLMLFFYTMNILRGLRAIENAIFRR